jgi:hypothetical protein
VAGTSKYGLWNRLWRGIYDLVGVGWLQKRTLRPAAISSAESAAGQAAPTSLAAQGPIAPARQARPPKPARRKRKLTRKDGSLSTASRPPRSRSSQKPRTRSRNRGKDAA